MLLQPGWGTCSRRSRNRQGAAGTDIEQLAGGVVQGRAERLMGAATQQFLATAAGQPRLWQVLAARRQTRNLGQTRQRICRSTFLAHLCRLYFTARPMEDGLAEAIDDGKVGPRDDPKTRGKVLVDDFGWDKVPFSLCGLLVSYKDF